MDIMKNGVVMKATPQEEAQILKLQKEIEERNKKNIEEMKKKRVSMEKFLALGFTKEDIHLIFGYNFDEEI